MFGDTLLESSSASGKRKRWPMATAFTLEMIIAGVMVMIPLLSTGVISVSARVLPTFTPVKPVTIETRTPVPLGPHASGADSSARQAVVPISNNPNAIHIGREVAVTTDPNWEITGTSIGEQIPTGFTDSGPSPANVRPGPKGPKRVVSQLTEAQLLNRVEPVYPHIAVLSGIQGEVKLHAIIARDGSVQSLNVTSGHPLLASAALDAVRQWRYRPYLLNGEAVEVETFITVNFKKSSY